MSTQSKARVALAILAVTGLFASGNASAFLDLPTNTAMTFVITGFNGTTVNYSSDTQGLTSICTSVATCNAAGGPAPGAATASEDSWGVANVSNLNDSNGNALWSAGDQGKRISLMFYGINDASVTQVRYDVVNFWNLLIRSTGGFADFYLFDAAEGAINATGGPKLCSDSDANPASCRADEDSYLGVTNKPGAELFLRLQFVPGAIENDTTTTFTSNYNVLTRSGHGQAFLDVVGGSAAALFNTNSLMDENGDQRDFLVNVTGQTGATNGWTLQVAGQATTEMQGAYYTPEAPVPGTLLLLGPGLLAMGAWRRWARRA